jgi:DNA ligase (NAD+)
VSRNCFDIEGLGGTHIENFHRDGLLKVPGDIFRLPKKNDEIKKREGLGDLSVRNLMTAIEARKAAEPGIETLTEEEWVKLAG